VQLSGLSALWDSSVSLGSSSLEMLFLGMGFFYLCIHLFYLLRLFPSAFLNPAKTTTRARLETKEKYLNFQTRYVHDYPSAPFDSVVVIFVFLGFLLLNRHFALVSENTAVYVLILWVSYYSIN
jgi:hypothetical protein